MTKFETGTQAMKCITLLRTTLRNTGCYNGPLVVLKELKRVVLGDHELNVSGTTVKDRDRVREIDR